MQQTPKDNVEHLIIKLAWVCLAWILLSFVGVMFVEYVPGNAQTWIESLLFSMLSALLISPALLFAFSDIGKEKPEIQNFQRTSGMQEVPETFEERDKLWNG
jgi:hypothetical protein